MKPQDIPPRILRLNQLANGLQKEQADIIRNGQPFTREEAEAYLDGGRRPINGLGPAALELGQVARRLEGGRGKRHGA